MNNPEANHSLLVVYNPISGNGRAQKQAQELMVRLDASGIPARLIVSSPSIDGYQAQSESIAASTLVVVVGGDGTLRSMLPVLASTRTPVYMIPSGNESLFAQIYGMTGSLDQLIDSLAAGSYTEQYFGLITSSTNELPDPFYIMASMGIDSLTVKKIGKRIGPISDSVYVWKGLLASLTLHHPEISIEIDNKPVVQRQRGYMIIANSSAYAKKLLLVPHATPSDDKLWVGFLPKANCIHELQKLAWMAREKPAKLPLQYYSGHSIKLALHSSAYPLQVDGDYFRFQDLKKDEEVRFATAPKSLHVLLPK